MSLLHIINLIFTLKLLIDDIFLQAPVKLIAYSISVTTVVEPTTIARVVIDAKNKHTTTLANGEKVVRTYRYLWNTGNAMSVAENIGNYRPNNDLAKNDSRTGLH